MKIDTYTDKGKRNNNEDFVFSERINDDSILCAIADGMGGYSKGEIASEMAVRSIYEYLKQQNGPISEDVIAHSIVSANEALKNYRKANNLKLGTTLGGVVIAHNKAIVFWIGDVRIFIFRNSKLIFESQDHSLLNELKKNNSLPDNWDINKIKHVVTRSISGNGHDFTPDFFEIDTQPSDVVIICSDGFLESANISFIKNIVSEHVVNDEEIKDRCRISNDNASIIVLKKVFV